MASDNEAGYASSSPSEAHAQLLYKSLEQYNDEQKRRKRPTIVLAALSVLFLSSAGGIALAVVLMVKAVVNIEAACLSRDLILFSAAVALLYICLHIKGARKDYHREGPGPPQIYGHYLHASALLVARLGIGAWIAALVATAVLIAKAIPFESFAGKVPFLNLVICIGAIPSFIIISATIERNPTPFATTAISRNSFLTCRVSEFADDLAADLSVSRRASLHRKQSQGGGSILTLPTEEIFRLGVSKLDLDSLNRAKYDAADDKTELMASSPIRTTTQYIPYRPDLEPASPVPPMPKMPDPAPLGPPQPAYYPGGWCAEWNNVAQEVGVSRIPESSTVVTGAAGPTSTATRYASRRTPAGTTSSSHASSQPSDGAPGSDDTSPPPHKGHRRATASTSITSSGARSSLSTVRYASEPEVAVRQPIKVVRNPAYTPTTSTVMSPNRKEGKEEQMVRKPEPVALLRSAQQAQKTAGTPRLQRKPSNFSRPIPPAGRRGPQSKVDSGVEMKIPGAFV
ncbi:hypothetical protein F5Y19DRAFT_58035 [Xylariaceae sp. FL1651]|nr:hypothetical protein F5Y19DRAFT_58035 [Xylariaceae sp. FL1651]